MADNNPDGTTRTFPTNPKLHTLPSTMNNKHTATLLLILTVLGAGCIDSEETSLEGDVNVLVGEMYFEQVDSELDRDILEANTGDEIVFYNEGNVGHTVTIPYFNLDEDIAPGDTVELVVDEEVKDTLVECTLHGTHEASLTVVE